MDFLLKQKYAVATSAFNDVWHLPQHTVKWLYFEDSGSGLDNTKGVSFLLNYAFA